MNEPRTTAGAPREASSDDARAASAPDKTYRPAEIEARHAARWEKDGAFRCGRNSGKPFTIVIPPPNVTGSLHTGHALNNTLQDILVRYHRMKGRDALWQPGTDHAGIATQMVVERRLTEKGIGLKRGIEAAAAGASGNKQLLSRDEFVKRVWEWKEESGGTITRQLRRLGASVDWSRERFTMDDGLSAAVLKVFVDLYRQGLIYKDKRLVNWDPKFHTAISDLEVEQKEVPGHLWHINYPIDGAAGEFITVATTRPETMLGDTAVAVHPTDERWAKYVGKFAVLPLVGRKIPIVADEYSDPEKGTGAVKITPGHDFNDFEVGRRHNLEALNIFTAAAHLNDTVPEAYRGMDRFVARRQVVADLEAAGLLVKVEPHRHMVPHGDRSDVAIEPYLTEQWYVNAKKLAEPAIAAVEQGKTVFVPDQFTKVYYHWMHNIEPWCVSRQLWWGHQIPAWYGPDQKVFVAYDEAEAKAEAKQHYGKDVALTRDPDVLDTWFSSGLWAFSTLGWPEQTPELKRYYPTDVLVTGFDIIFFWVARMMMLSLHFMKDVPFRHVYIHGLVRDAKGQKMSKTRGNVIDPLELIDKFGTDALRFTLSALAVPGRDIKLSESRVEGYRNFATKLWNAARYAEMNQASVSAGFDPAKAALPVNRWILGELRRTAAAFDEAIAGFRFNDAAGVLYKFLWNNFCDWYLEFTKPTLQGADETAKAETRSVTAWVLRETLKLLHPIMPFITEELWARQGGTDMLAVTSWPDFAAIAPDSAADDEMSWVIDVVSQIRTLRSEMNVPAAARLALSYKDTSAAAQARLKRHSAIIQTLARLERIEPAGEAVPKGAVQLVVREATLLLPLAGVIDAAAERTRLRKEVDRLDKDIAGIERKLANPDFIAKADPEVVEENRERLTDAQAARARLATAVQRLESL